MTGLLICEDDRRRSDIAYPLPVRLPARLVAELRKRARADGCSDDATEFGEWLGVQVARSLPMVLGDALEAGTVRRGHAMSRLIENTGNSGSQVSMIVPRRRCDARPGCELP
jgi:hypothetical protein